ncbi:MAG: DnaA/Hda family protein [Planctomycetota bacterium]
MSASQGSIEAQEAIGLFTEALRQRVGDDRFRLWFTHGVRFDLRQADEAVDRPAEIMVWASGPFAAKRIAKNFAGELRAAAMLALGDGGTFAIDIDATTCTDSTSHADTDSSESIDHQPRRAGPAPTRRPRRKSTRSLARLLDDDASATKSTSKSTGARHPAPPAHRSDDESQTDFDDQNGHGTLAGRTMDSFVTGECNEFAYSAATMAVATPQVATPLFLHGPTGTGKTHLMTALADAFRSRRRMRRVVLLSAEQFTNDFLASVGTTGLPAFRKRYRNVDALLIDDVQFLATKTATLREMLYTVESLSGTGTPLVFTANMPPAEIQGLTGEVAGRMSSGLVCPLMPIDTETRAQLLRRATQQRCLLRCDDGLLAQVAERLPGDARGITGVANLISMLQRMYRREPTLAEIQRHGGDLMRGQTAAPTLRKIEAAVCEAFGLERDGLRGRAQTRRVSEPRMLAMYLARQMTGSAFTEIARHFGRRSHTGAIAAQSKVAGWLNENKSIGGGESSLTAHDAIAKIEAKLRAG